MKALTFIITFFLMITAAVAQKRDTAAYYMLNTGEMAESKETADFVRLLLPPDTTEDRDLIRINDFYVNGKRKLIARSYINSINFANGLQGSYLEYYPNGKRRSIQNYDHGKPVGERIDYYPNGKVMSEITFSGADTLLMTHMDSAGKVLTKNGKGNWVKYNRDLTFFASGEVKDGKEEGVWTGSDADLLKRKGFYKQGVLLTGNLYTPVKEKPYDTPPEFIGGAAAFSKFLFKTLRYTKVAREAKIQGTVVVGFTIDINGDPKDIRILRGIGSGLDEEAIKVIQASPKWKPALKNGVPVEGAFSVSINFDLDQM